MSAIPLSETAAKRRIGDILVEHGFVTPEELADATLEQERTQQPLGQILVGRGTITRLELASALAEQWSDPAASISSTSRSSPTPPAPAPSAQDEAQYAARLQDAVADLARKVQSNEPLEGIDERVDELSRRIEGTLARTQHIEAAVATLAESLEGVTTGVEEAFFALQAGTTDLVGDLARIEQTVGEIAAREMPAGDAPSRADLEELQAAVSGLSDGTAGTAELKDQVEDLVGRLDALADPQASFEAVSQRVEHVAVQLEALQSATNLEELERTVRDLESRSRSVVDLAERLDRVEAESGGEQAEIMIRIDALADRFSELSGAGPRAVDGRLDDLARTIEAVRGELADVAVSARPDGASAERVESLAAWVETLAGESDETRGVVAKLEALEERLADGVVSPDALARSIEQAMSERDSPVTDERVENLTAEVASLRAELASLAHRDLHDGEDEANRLTGIESRVDDLSRERTEASALAARLEELEQARAEEMDTVNVLAVAMDRIRHDLTKAKPPAEGEPSAVLEAVATLTQRIAALEDAPVALPPPAHDDELVSEVERLRLILERIGLHLGEHDRAIADLAPGRGVEERLQELTMLVQNLAELQAQSEHAAPASASRSAGTGDVGVLLQRVQEAEAASQTDSEKLMNRLERMASSIDSRLQQLESDETQ